jgi:hypothetical protein
MAEGTDPSGNRYHGFSLGGVTWGYRETFQQVIEELFRQGKLGPGRQQVTERFFELLKQSDQGCFDHVLHQFLGAMSPQNRWILDLPGIFADLVDLGASLAQSRLYFGIRFFQTLAAGGMGESPQQVRQCLTTLRHLRQIDDELAMAFLAGYGTLRQRLRPNEQQRYVESAEAIHARNREAALRFLRAEGRNAEAYILAITQECRLVDVGESLCAMLQGLTGAKFEVDDLSGLDCDDLIDRGSTALTVEGHLYLPQRVRRFDSSAENRNWYLLCGIASAGMILDDAFARIHGHRDYRTCEALAGGELRRVNLFVALEYARVLLRAMRRWPGAARLIRWGLRDELADAQPGSAENLLLRAVVADDESPALRAFSEVADGCGNCFETAGTLDGDWTRAVLETWPGLDRLPIRPVAFLSDFLLPASFSTPPTDRLVADLKDSAPNPGRDEDSRPEGAADPDATGQSKPDADEQPESAAQPAAYAYDEWDKQINDYREKWCLVHPRPVEPAPQGELPPGWRDPARKVRAVFERLRPDLARREKRLEEGDAINVDLLVEHLVDRVRQPDPPARFYEKPIIHHRDLAVLILLDVSGSTGEETNGAGRVLDVEKRAAIILGQGLEALDDRFAIHGFHTNGREQCDYLLFKDFDDDFRAAVPRILNAWPRHSTRIGPALRHAGALLARQSHRQRLILLVTDGKPMDQGYDPNTRYAQHDVRMACEENRRQDIHTFAISTEENSLADMEIMFPARRFVILPDIEHLPRILPKLYMRLTL